MMLLLKMVSTIRNSSDPPSSMGLLLLLPVMGCIADSYGKGSGGERIIECRCSRFRLLLLLMEVIRRLRLLVLLLS
jgi:hypothetical protein